jgi:hypothetical protein
LHRLNPGKHWTETQKAPSCAELLAKMLTATIEVRVHPASPAKPWPSRDGTLKLYVTAKAGKDSSGIMQDPVLCNYPPLRIA